MVFGAVFDGNYEVKITYSETLEGVRFHDGKQYLQARVETGFADAERFLKSGASCFVFGNSLPDSRTSISISGKIILICCLYISLSRCTESRCVAEIFERNNE